MHGVADVVVRLPPGPHLSIWLTTVLNQVLNQACSRYTETVRHKTLSPDTLKNILLQLESVGLLRLEQDKGIGDVQSFAPLCPAIYLPSPGGAEGD